MWLFNLTICLKNKFMFLWWCVCVCKRGTVVCGVLVFDTFLPNKLQSYPIRFHIQFRIPCIKLSANQPFILRLKLMFQSNQMRVEEGIH